MRLPRRKQRGQRDHLFFLFAADLHGFHRCGLTPPDFESSTGIRLPLNRFQRYLYDCYEYILDHLPPVIDGLFLVGDIGEGQNLAEMARGISEAEPSFQARGMAHLLKPVADRVVAVNGQKNIVMVRGSRYHTGHGAAIEEAIGSCLGAKKKWNYYSPPWREIDLTEHVLLDVAHHQSYTIRYRFMPLERELGFKLESMGRARRTLPEEVLVVRAHTHTGFRCVREKGATMLSLPAMKMQDFFAQGSKTPNRMVPDNVGMVPVKVYFEPVNGSRVHVMEDLLFDHPAMEREVLLYE